jgi:hypothetical protein
VLGLAFRTDGGYKRLGDVDMIEWEALYRRTVVDTRVDAPASRRPYSVPKDVLADVRRIVTEVPISDLDFGWLEAALADGQRRWFAAAVCAQASGTYLDADDTEDGTTPLRRARLPSSLLDALVTAAVLERDPSFDGKFVRPAVWMFGWAATVDGIARYVRDGSAAEKWGAVNALYHASGAWRPPYGPETIDLETWDEHWRPVTEAMLTEFVSTKDLPLQQTIVRWLMPVDNYPPALRNLARRAIEIARSHRDPFVRDAGMEIDEDGRARFRSLPRRTDRPS